MKGEVGQGDLDIYRSQAERLIYFERLLKGGSWKQSPGERVPAKSTGTGGLESRLLNGGLRGGVISKAVPERRVLEGSRRDGTASKCTGMGECATWRPKASF